MMMVIVMMQPVMVHPIGMRRDNHCRWGRLGEDGGGRAKRIRSRSSVELLGGWAAMSTPSLTPLFFKERDTERKTPEYRGKQQGHFVPDSLDQKCLSPTLTRRRLRRF